MKTSIPSIIAGVLAASLLVFVPVSASASPRGEAARADAPFRSGDARGGQVRFSGKGGHPDDGNGDAGHGRHEPSFTERCQLIDTRYFTRGCDRYAKKIYLHERVDCHGHVVKCWKSQKTLRVGGHRRH